MTKKKLRSVKMNILLNWRIEFQITNEIQNIVSMLIIDILTGIILTVNVRVWHKTIFLASYIINNPLELSKELSMVQHVGTAWLPTSGIKMKS